MRLSLVTAPAAGCDQRFERGGGGGFIHVLCSLPQERL